MSEKINLNNENQREQTAEHHRKNYDVSKDEPKKRETAPARHEHRDHIDQIIEKIDKSAKSSDELAKSQLDSKKDEPNDQSLFIGSQLSSQALKQSLRKIQKRLPKYQRPFSKLIHNKNVEKINVVASNTIARPSGLLMAGIVSFVVSIVVLSMSRYFGYEYNYLVGLLSLAVGFIAGLFIEALAKMLKRT